MLSESFEGCTTVLASALPCALFRSPTSFHFGGTLLKLTISIPKASTVALGKWAKTITITG